MSKEEVALQLTLSILEKFDLKVSEYGGDTLTDHQENFSKLAFNIYNDIYNNLNIK